MAYYSDELISRKKAVHILDCVLFIMRKPPLFPYPPINRCITVSDAELGAMYLRLSCSMKISHFTRQWNCLLPEWA